MATVALSGIITPSNVVTATSTTTLSNKTLVAPALGTPVSGNLSNCTGIPSPSAATSTALGTVYGNTPTASTANMSVGYQAANALTTGYGITAVGYEVLKANTTGFSNTAMGEQSMLINTSGNYNAGFGGYALYSNTTGQYNTASSYNALSGNTTGSYNVAVGSSALSANTTASNNTAVGYESLKANTTGDESVSIGHFAGKAATTGGYNVFVGKSAGVAVTTSTSGVFIGGYCGTNNTTGSRNTYIGYGLSGSSASVTDEIVITSGSGGTGKGGSTGFINPATGGVYQGNNSSLWSVTSDQRLKKNIVDNNIGLEKLTQIQVRNFEYRLPEEVTELPQNQAIKKSGIQLGVIAQELQQILPECVKTESTGVMSVDADNLTWYLINAVKELSARVKQLEGN